MNMYVFPVISIVESSSDCDEIRTKDKGGYLFHTDKVKLRYF